MVGMKQYMIQLEEEVHLREQLRILNILRSLGVPVTVNVVLNNKNISGVKYFFGVFDRLDVKYAFDRFFTF